MVVVVWQRELCITEVHEHLNRAVGAPEHGGNEAVCYIASHLPVEVMADGVMGAGNRVVAAVDDERPNGGVSRAATALLLGGVEGVIWLAMRAGAGSIIIMAVLVVGGAAKVSHTGDAALA